MADKELRSVRFPGLDDRYVVPEGGGGGAPGPAGKDGITPTIGENGNWYLGDIDTQKPSRGEKGADGAAGKDGSDGHTPVITAEKSGKVTTIKADGVTIATVNDGTDGTNGTDGAPGAKGDTGATPDIQIGTVTTLPAGSDATASMSGTAENPLLNLGIPKGEAGGSDLSLGITGATIGQIAKITAVDTDGKPTEWEPVDMPAVSDEYELLIDQPALIEDVVLCNFDVPDCDKYIVLVSLVNTSASAGSRALQVNMNGSNYYKAITGIANVIGPSGTRSAYFKIERLQNRFYSMVWNSQNGDGIIGGVSDNMSSCNMCAFDAPENGVQKLTVTSLNSSISHFLGVGTRIKIYGVKKL